MKYKFHIHLFLELSYLFEYLAIESQTDSYFTILFNVHFGQ